MFHRRIIEAVEEEEVEEIDDITDPDTVTYSCKGVENIQDDYYTAIGGNDSDSDNGSDCGDGDGVINNDGIINKNIKKSEKDDVKKVMNYTNHRNRNTDNASTDNDNSNSSNNNNNTKIGYDEIIPENNLGNVPTNVPKIQVIENEMLNYDKGRTGDVYRSIRNR